MSIPMKDRSSKVEQFRIDLAMCDIGVNYETADLIDMILTVSKKQGDKFNIKHTIKIKIAHEEKWRRYFEPKDKLSFSPQATGYFYCKNCEEKINEDDLLTDDKHDKCGSHVKWIEFVKNKK